MKLADLCIRRPVFATMLIGFLVALGIFSYRQLAVDLFPNLDYPIVSVTTTLKGASVEEVESGVTKPVEEVINTIEGIDELRSVTKEGLSQVLVFFVMEREREAAAQDVRDKVASIMSQLPEGTDTPIVDKFDVELLPISGIAVSGNRSLREVTEIARKQVKEDLETLRGVGSVTMVGGLERTINVDVDAQRLAAYHISIQQVKAALRAQNLELPSGRVDRGPKELVLRTMGRIARVEDFNQLIVGNVHGRPLTVGDVGTVTDSVVSVRQPELRVHINRQKASDFGIKVQDIAATLRTLVGGEPVTRFKEKQDQYDVWLPAQLPNRNDPHALSDLTIATPTGELVKLANLADLSEERGPAQIDHYSRQRKVTLVANLDNVPLSTAMAKIREIVAGLDLPPNYTAEFSGRAKALGETGTNFLLAFGLSLLFMYMILAAQFESFLHPVTILLALPLSIPFALISLLVLGETLNIYSILGLFMLFGIVKKNGILQIDYTNTLRAQGMPRDAAIVEANHVRLRPILMTTMMLVAGMIPIAVGAGPGSASRASMAKVIIGGQTMCLLLSLLLTPVAYSLFDDLGRMRLLARAAEWAGGLVARLSAASNGRSRA